MNGFDRRVIKSAIKLGFNVKPQPSRLDRKPKLDRRAYIKALSDMYRSIKVAESALKPLYNASRGLVFEDYRQDVNNVLRTFSGVQSAYNKLIAMPALQKFVVFKLDSDALTNLQQAYKRAIDIAEFGGDYRSALNGLVSASKRIKGNLSLATTGVDLIKAKLKGELYS